jgi:hypothetical protein
MMRFTPERACGVHSPYWGVGFSFLLSFLWASILIFGGSSLLLSSVFRVEDGVGPDRPAIKVVGVVDQVFH